MKASFVSGVMVTIVPEDGDSFDYQMALHDDDIEGAMVVLACGEESVVIYQGVWDELKENIDGLFMNDEA